jgi:hypothetical protein
LACPEGWVVASFTEIRKTEREIILEIMGKIKEFNFGSSGYKMAYQIVETNLESSTLRAWGSLII